jgi:superfamily I DNA/RNA helicase
MTWLHPTQARLAGRQWSGPARARGAAGTGKTVVALHRAKYLAARGERVLLTSLVRTLGPVYRALLTRMAPEQVDRIEFATVHAVAARCLREHGLADRYQQTAADNCFWLAWGNHQGQRPDRLRAVRQAGARRAQDKPPPFWYTFSRCAISCLSWRWVA